MSKKQKKMLVRIIIAAVMLIALKFHPGHRDLVQLALYLVAYLVIGYDILSKAGKGIVNRRVFDENFLMAVATVGAFALAIYEKSGDYTEGHCRHAVLPDRRAVPELRGRQEPPEHHAS